MLILAVDTSGKSGGIALARGEGKKFQLLGMTPLAGGTYSADLVPRIDVLLRDKKVSLGELDGFAVASGPGSFTGLRVGLATVKGLAEITGKPIVAISVLEVVANLGSSMLALMKSRKVLFAGLDAGRSEVYFGEFGVDWERGLQPGGEFIGTYPEFIAHIRGHALAGAGLIVSPDKAVLEAAASGGLPAMKTGHPVADDFARIGIFKFAAGKTIAAETLDANYIRRSDAELFSLPKTGSAGKPEK